MEVKKIGFKNIAFKVEDSFHMQVKIQAIKEGKTLQEYIISLLKKDIEQKAKENK
jgi:predicted HicB family RNase H-like nuclease